MKLLIVTQVVDPTHPILGFFHRWIEVMAARCERIHVVCLEAGAHTLPPNVTVHSLGKERGSGRLRYLGRFFKYVWQLRREYDTVFVHMNQEYVLLAGTIWKLLGKRILFWRNHYAGSFLTSLSALFCDRIFYTSHNSYTSRFKKAERMPIGIDEELFSEHPSERVKDSLLYVGRIAPSKNVDLILRALHEILTHKPHTTLTIVGPIGDELYMKSLQALITEGSLPVTFLGSVPWKELPQLYSRHELCINMSPPGMFDKVIGEALLCGADILTTNRDLKEVLGERVIESSNEAIAQFVNRFEYSKETVERLRREVISQHSLKTLVQNVLT